MQKSYFTFKDHYSLASATYKRFIFNSLGNDYSIHLEPPPEGIGLHQIRIENGCSHFILLGDNNSKSLFQN